MLFGDLLFYLDNVGGVTRTRALKLFKKFEEPYLSSRDIAGRDLDELCVRTTKRFRFLIKFVACGAIIRMAS